MSTQIVIIAQVLGIISWLLLMYSYTKEDIDELLIVQISVCLLDFVSYVLLGADAGLLICLLELIQTIMYYKTTKDKEIFKVSMFTYFLIGLLTIKKWYACLPVIGSVIDSFGTSKDSKSANICSIISNTLWAIYDVLILSYIGALNDIVVVLCNISILTLGYSRLMHISKFRIIKYRYLTRKTINKIYNLDLKNYGIENTWEENYQLNAYKKNNDSFFIIKYKHEIVGYINYLNIKYEGYEKIKKSKNMPNIINLNDILEFKSNRKSYLLIESINIKKIYEKNESIELINKKIKNFIKSKRRQRVYIHGIIGFAMTKFEEEVFINMGFNKIKIFNNNVSLYELEIDKN